MSHENKVWIFYDAYREKQSKPLNQASAQIMIINLINKVKGRYFIWTQGWDGWVLIEDFLASDQADFVNLQMGSNPKIHYQTSKLTDASEDINEVGSYNITQLSNGDLSSPESTATGTQSEITHTDKLQNVNLEHSFTDIVLEPKNLDPNDFYAPDFQGDNLSLNTSERAPNFLEMGRYKTERRKTARFDIKIELVIMNPMGRTFRSFSKNISHAGSLLEMAIPKEFLGVQLEIVVVNKFEKVSGKGRVALKGKAVGETKETQRIYFEPMSDKIREQFEGLLKSYIEERKVRSGKVS